MNGVRKCQNLPKWSVNSNPSLSTGNMGFVVAISSKLYEVRNPDFKMLPILVFKHWQLGKKKKKKGKSPRL